MGSVCLVLAVAGCAAFEVELEAQRRMELGDCDFLWNQRDISAKRGENSRAERYADLYRKCVNSPKVSGSTGSGSSTAAGALLMGVICSATSNPSGCMTGAAETLSGKEPANSSTEGRLKETEEKLNQLEQRMRNQCISRGGFYNPITGCSR